ncbi:MULTISPECIES: hypothetical protein [unclassified Mesorhizobium]|uniref:hypothetical protein n=1 Tax=unclassified Mesorhizobium TaxID=325217 RepID=UPI001FE01A4E|nr:MULTISPECIES: hypothetical protein [unclassified Mesorhizobium]
MPANEVDFRDELTELDDRRDGFDVVLTLTREQARRPAGAILSDRREGRSGEDAPRVADAFDPWAATLPNRAGRSKMVKRYRKVTIREF